MTCVVSGVHFRNAPGIPRQQEERRVSATPPLSKSTEPTQEVLNGDLTGRRLSIWLGGQPCRNWRLSFACVNRGNTGQCAHPILNPEQHWTGKCKTARRNGKLSLRRRKEEKNAKEQRGRRINYYDHDLNQHTGYTIPLTG